ncbi:MAG TPA: helix-turn-helix domain-containing protein [Acetobacteraceae bacterium]|nr:helix-turn-helix domain-containing protein [Acetobacteraceae bacterium]
MAIAIKFLKRARQRRWRMRVSREKAAENRDRILTEAARLFRERGLSGVGVDALTEAAGLTHGSLYSRFGSKERLAAEAVGHAASTSADRMADAATLADYVARYLSPEHRERRGGGCVVAALGSEIPRQGAAIRHSFTDATRSMVKRIARLLPGRRADAALATTATMVGALILARAVDDPEFSDRILAAARTQLLSCRARTPSRRRSRASA